MWPGFPFMGCVIVSPWFYVALENSALDYKSSVEALLVPFVDAESMVCHIFNIPLKQLPI